MSDSFNPIAAGFEKMERGRYRKIGDHRHVIDLWTDVDDWVFRASQRGKPIGGLIRLPMWFGHAHVVEAMRSNGIHIDKGGDDESV
jgi:hypothetical protein